jgi:cyclopropane fatty-acyl-phospholipid synthase-like methyltransferase
MSTHPLKILDCACGIGTQSLGLAAMGHQVVASDLSPAQVNRARREAESRSLNTTFHTSDMVALQEIPESGFDVVVALDNALPHLTEAQLPQAMAAIASKLQPNGLFMASIRDYDQLMFEKPTMQPPAFYGTQKNRRIVHQVWDWIADDTYILHLYITIESDGQSPNSWKTHHFVSEYRCLLRTDVTTALQSAGFNDVQWLMSSESGYYQPLVLARSSL